MFNYNGFKVFLACGSTDMRKNVNGFCEMIQHHFQLGSAQKIISQLSHQQKYDFC